MNSPCPPLHTLSRYSFGELDDASAASVDSHLGGCDRCLSRLDGIARRELAHERVAGAAETDPPAALERAIAAAIDGGQHSTSHFPRPDIPDYKLHERIGQGGMGTVYRATHQRLGKTVAVKVLRRGRLHDADAVARFEREMLAVGRLDHPNIVRATDAGEANGVHFLVMEFIPGIDLSRLVKANGPLPLAEACRYVVQAARGLEAAHRHGMVHRDVKPSNLMRTPDGVVKVLDLGLACLPVDAETPPPEQVPPATDTRLGQLTETGHTVGTRDYMAPEQMTAPQTVGPAADVYGLGATLWHLITGYPPPQQPTLFPPPQSSLPAALWRKLLATDSADRLTSAAVAEVLERYTKPIRRRHRRGWMWAAVAVSALVLVPVAAFALKPASDSPPAVSPRPSAGALPMTPDEAVVLRSEWAKHLGQKPTFANSVGMTLTLVPPGEVDLAPHSHFTLTRAFAMGQHEVTRKQFAEFVAATGHRTTAERAGTGAYMTLDVQTLQVQVNDIPGLNWRAPGYSNPGDEDAVTQVSWDDATAFCEWLSKAEGRTYRLPTQVEWVWAARAGDVSPGPGLTPGVAPQQLAPRQPTQPVVVGLGKPNAWGIHDMLGNVAEWCGDWFSQLQTGRFVDFENAVPNPQRTRVMFGPSYVNGWSPTYFYRSASLPVAARSNLGFRVVCEIEPNR